ncbi:DUF6286 domain-containing protein [Actinokineospora bangkokensis]|uniref:DUF6286 domain-containing protein n=1 Tax=Actinokineospora bangkokensis TaxID=1193682 RepID=A0A1Q9LMN7_9PSEU|nr:DUF6286 domain-containing protein [Actinokineospora bangkokensis]OLR93275.1 hypothetical protein BJP25_17490 [Actinokineospora bangkokensis]
MKRRPRRSTPAVLVALVLLAASVLVGVSAVQQLLGEPTWISYDSAARALNGLRWNDTAVLIAAGAVGLVGAVLLLSAVTPGRPTVLPLAEGAGGIDSGVSRRSYRSTLRRAAASVDGVTGAAVSVTARAVKAVVTTNRVDTTGLSEAVRAAVQDRVDAIGPQRPPTVKIKVKAPRSTP